MNRKTKLVLLTSLSFLILGSLACTIVVGENNPIASAEAATKTADSPIKPTATMLFPDSEIPGEGTFLGDYIAKSGYFFAALELEYREAASGSFDYTKGSKLAAVLLVFGNQTGEQVTWTDFQLKDSEGNLHDAEFTTSNGRFPAVTIDQGERAKGWIEFPISEGEKPETVICKFGLRSNEAVELGVGPAPEGHTPLEVNTSFATPVRSKLGEVAYGGGYSLTALKVEDPSASAPALMNPPQDGFHLAAVQIAVVNTGHPEKMNIFDILDLSLVDSNGFLYAPALFGRTDQMDGGDFPLNKEYKGWVSFIVPNGVQLASVKYYNSREYGLVYAGLAE
jgi:hypothetical protein